MGGNISIILTQDNEKLYLLSVSDNGVGFTKPDNLTYQDTFVCSFITELVEKQLQGVIDIDSSPNKGTKVQIKFKPTLSNI